MADFPATARIPCRPLEMAYKDLAEPKELLVDYSTGKISVCLADGTFVDIENIIKEIIKEDSSISESIQNMTEERAAFARALSPTFKPD